MCWQRKGNGRAYNSRLGHGAIIVEWKDLELWDPS